MSDAHRRRPARGHPRRQRRPAPIQCPGAGCCPTRSGTTSASPGPTSGASTACAGRARCSSTASPMRSCLIFAVSADGAAITTTEGCLRRRRRARTGPAGLPRLPRAAVRLLHARLHHHDHGLPRRHPDPTEAEAREAIGGNLCRCTGYQNIVAAVLRAAELRRDSHGRWAQPDDPRRCSGSGSSGSRIRGCWPDAGVTSTTSGRTLSRRRSCGARTRTPASSTSTRPPRSRSTGWSRSTPTTTSTAGRPSRCRC